MKIALLGAGTMGSFHADTLRAHPDLTELRIYDADPARRTVDTVEAALDGADAAVIATPARTHAEMIADCLDRGLPTFCEKPVAMTLEETEAIVQRVEQKGGVLQVGFQRRFDPAYVAARRRIQAGELGRVYSFYMAARDRRPPSAEYVPTSGGFFRDSHIHDFDITRWLFGAEVAEVFVRGAVLGDLDPEIYLVDTTGMVLSLDDGTIGVIGGGRDNPAGYDIRAEVFGSRDSLAIGERRRYDDFRERFAEAYRAEMLHFLDLARGRAENPGTAADALAALRVAVAAEQSLAEGRSVPVV
jgi:myo-inositol 2-dehydrogenase/D-chiro-inositol 1-dehydrogenase